jgi:hypothetical protein
MVTELRRGSFSPIVAWIGLSWFCIFVHWLATAKMQARIMINTQTINAMTLTTFMEAHTWIPISYLSLGAFILLFAWQRRYPRWAIWLSFVGFASPVILYLWTSFYLANKIIIG